jgi:glutathione S-transferase
MNCGLRIRLASYPEDLARDVRRLAELWHEGLNRFAGPYLAGEVFTAVDAFFAPVALRAQTYGIELPTQAADYAKRLRELPSMRDWYNAALAETFREPGHEDEARAAGTWLEDLRAR